MAGMLNRPDEWTKCGCCTTYMRTPYGRRHEEREWRREWSDEMDFLDAVDKLLVPGWCPITWLECPDWCSHTGVAC